MASRGKRTCTFAGEWLEFKVAVGSRIGLDPNLSCGTWSCTHGLSQEAVFNTVSKVSWLEARVGQFSKQGADGLCVSAGGLVAAGSIAAGSRFERFRVGPIRKACQSWIFNICPSTGLST